MDGDNMDGLSMDGQSIYCAKYGWAELVWEEYG